jgi:precorrin-6A/cobalt-precorrin-6A reductase
MKHRLLILGGTGEARELAAVLHGVPDLTVISSLAGRTSNARLPIGELRIGGFGGPERLAGWLRAERVDAVVDATHPFAARMTAGAVAAASLAGTPLLVLRRPGWHEGPGDRWHWTDSLGKAASALAGLGERVFLTTGRQGVGAFTGLAEHWFLARCVDPPEPPLPARCEVLLDRGPFTVAGELELMRRHTIEVVVTKDSGGPMTAAKLTAARELGLPVIVVRRPALPAGVLPVATVEEAARWVLALA